MIGDRVNSKPKHARAASQIYPLIAKRVAGGQATLTVAGQSGAGKSEVAQELATLLDAAGHKTMIFQQDDYFFYPPKTNHNRRVDDIEWVGTKEVNLKLLDEHLNAFRHTASTVLEKPLVIFAEDRVIDDKIDLSPFTVLIAEGTYTTLLKNVDYRIFIDRDYHDTREDRKERGREVIDDFSDKILRIEHDVISKHKPLADIIVNKDFSVTAANR